MPQNKEGKASSGFDVSAGAYDVHVRETLPFYDEFHRQTIDIVRTLQPVPALWLDTGCGTAALAARALPLFPQTRFLLADPSAEMLTAARARLGGASRVTLLPPCPTAALETGEHPSVISAIQCHHYLTAEGRSAATRRCFELLADGGMYVTFENIRPLTPQGVAAGLERWKTFQVSCGKDPAEAERHKQRFDKAYFPITVPEHLTLLKETGFKAVEILWYSHLQAGFYAVK